MFSPNEHIDALNEVIRTSAAPSRVVFSCQRTNKSIGLHSAPLYDESCKIQGLAYNKLRNKYNKTHTEEDKQQRDKVRSKYRNTCRKNVNKLASLIFTISNYII